MALCGVSVCFLRLLLMLMLTAIHILVISDNSLTEYDPPMSPLLPVNQTCLHFWPFSALPLDTSRRRSRWLVRFSFRASA